MKRLLYLCLLLACSLGVARARTLIQFRSVYGDVILELYDEEKPVTVKNFLRYVDDGLYKDMFFHRCVSNFVMQGGGFTIANRGTPSNTVTSIPTYEAITNEFNVGPFLSNVRGTIAMAKTANPNSATSQFFFNNASNTSLDNPANSGGFTVFGHVVVGDAILELWRTFALYNGTITNRVQTNVIANACAPGNPTCVFAELPLTRILTTETIFDELIYVEVTRYTPPALTALPGTPRRLQWIAEKGVRYVVEYTSPSLPIWLTLSETIGSGGLVTVTDPNGNESRYYRLRLPF